MRCIIYKRGGYGLGTVSANGGETDGAVLSIRDPSEENEAVTKAYSESKLVSIPMESFTSGSVPVTRISDFTGDVLKGNGASNTVCRNSGVVVGTYTKVQVNLKGIVYNSLTLQETDIPNLNWTKITSDKPTTLEGYGITDALNITGGTMTGTLRIDTVINDSLTLVNKSFADGTGTSGIVVNPGGIVYRTSSVTPNGYLRCNGGIVSKVTYPALYAAIGDNHTARFQPGAGRPWYQQYDFNEYTTDSLNNWIIGPSLAGARHGAQVAVIKDKIYLFGGASDSTSTATVQMTTINEDGSLNPWVTLPSLPFVFYRGQLVVIKNYIYFIGDVSATYVYRATINPDGSYQTPVLHNNLPYEVSRSQAVVTKNKIYLLGGITGSTELATTLWASIDSNGNIGSWNPGENLPEVFSLSAVAVVKNKVYLFGGYNGASLNRILGATITEEGYITGWSQVGTLSANVYGSSVIVTRNRIIMLTGSSTSSLIRYFPVNPDGTLGTVQNLTGHFLTSIMYVQIAIVKNRVYSIGGYDSTNLARTGVYYHTFEGGSNDYTNYYDGSYLLADNDSFRLPDLTSRLPKTNAFIRY